MRIVDVEASLGQGIYRGLLHATHRFLENLLPLKIPLGVANLPTLVAFAKTQAIYGKNLPGIAIAPKGFRYHTGLLLAGLQVEGGGTITKKYRHIAVRPIHNPGNYFRPDHQRTVDYTTANH